LPEDNSLQLFGIADWLVVLLYLAAMIFIGWWTGRGQKTKRDYFLGGRSLPWWAVGFSIIATETSALTFIGIPAAAIGAVTVNSLSNGEFSYSFAGGDMFFMMIVIGYITGRLVIIKFIVPKYFTGDVYTTYELIERAFGHRSRYAVAFISSIQIVLGAGVRVFVTAIPISLLLASTGISGGIPLAIFVIMIAAILYTLFGGIKAVVWTDMAQFIIFIIAGLITILYIPTLIDQTLATESGKTGWAAIFEVGRGPSGEGPLRIWNLGWSSDADLSLWEKVQGIFSSPYNFIMGVIAAPFGIIFAFGFDQMNVQRILACKNKRDGQKALLLSAVLIGPQFFLFLMIGTALFAFFNLNGFDFGGLAPVDPIVWESLKPGEEPATRNDFIYPIFIFTQLPVVLKGFLVAAILAAAMSSVSSALSALGSIALVDFYQPLTGNKESDPKVELNISRISVMASGVILLIVAFACSLSQKDLIPLAFTLSSIPGGAVMGAFLFAFFKGKGNVSSVVFGLLVGFTVLAILNLSGLIVNNVDNPPAILVSIKDFWGHFYWPWHVGIGCGITFMAASLWDMIMMLTGQYKNFDEG